MAQEVEFKLALPQNVQRAFLRHPLLKQATQKLPTRKLTNIYFDTSDLDLYRRGIALRLRKQGRQWLQTVKRAGTVAAGLSARPEWEQPAPNGAFDFSAVDDDGVRKRLQRAQARTGLVPVFETVFSRQTWRFESAPDSALLLMFDRGSINSQGRQEAISEIEIELDGGTTDSIFHLAAALGANLPLKPEPRSKAERGYRLFRGDPLKPVHAKVSLLDKRQTPAQAFQVIALDCLAHLQGNEAGTLASADPEFVHQMRVALRRLRSALRLFVSALPQDFAAPLLPRLRALANALGAARDWDVAIDELLAPVWNAFADDTRLARLRDTAENQRNLARQHARAALLDGAYGRLLLELVAALHAPAFAATAADADDLPAFAQRRLRKRRRRLAQLAEGASSLNIKALHALRVGVKRLRYGLEFFAPLYRGKTVKAEIATLAKLQTKLGLINDLANARRLLSERVGEDAELREALALVGGWYGPQVEAVYGELPARLAEVAKGKMR